MFTKENCMQGSNKLGETLIVLMGIWLIVSPIPDFAANIFAISYSQYGEGGSMMLLSSITHISAKILCGVILLTTRSKIISSLGLNINQVSDAKHLLSAALFVLGVYFILKGVVAFGQHYATTQMVNTSDPYLYWQGMFSTVAGAIISIASVVLSKLWWQLKKL